MITLMLDIQKERILSQRPEVKFTERIVMALAWTGWISPGLLMFHGMSFWSIVMLLWFLMTLSLIPHFTKGQNWARVGLGVLCLIGAAVEMLVQRYGNTLLAPRADPMLELEVLPKWSGIWCGATLLIGLTLLSSQRVKKAASLWFNFK
jgi:hypothetical protein